VRVPREVAEALRTSPTPRRAGSGQFRDAGERPRYGETECAKERADYARAPPPRVPAAGASNRLCRLRHARGSEADRAGVLPPRRADAPVGESRDGRHHHAPRSCQHGDRAATGAHTALVSSKFARSPTRAYTHHPLERHTNGVSDRGAYEV
jgi:hypothetical protein